MSQLLIEEISNKALRDLLENKAEVGIMAVFKHRYEGGQVDWGYLDDYGHCYAWFGGDDCQAPETNLDIFEVISV